MSFTRQMPVGQDVLDRWNADLGRLCPPESGLSRLRIVWEPGEPHQPVGRWMIWELFPASVTPAFILEDLQGEDPRTRGYFDEVLQKFIQAETSVSKAQWDLYRATQMYGQPFWVIQGTQGGHKRYYNLFEQRLFRMVGDMTGVQIPTQPPPPGFLPYAGYDRRVFDAITEGNDLRARWDEASKLTLPEAQHAARMKLAERLVKHLFTQIEDAVKDQKIDTDGIPRVARKDEVPMDLDQMTEQFIHSH
jgi:hypothetical protein